MGVNRTSSSLFERAGQIFPGGVNSPVRAFGSVGREPFYVSHAEGAYLYDEDGNRYVDFVNSWGPLVLGHAPVGVVKAISQQASQGTSYGTCHSLEIELAEIIREHMPSLEMLRFVNSGTEAGMAVIRLARGYTKRNKIVKFQGCYHGHADMLLAQAGSGVLTFGIPDCEGVPKSAVSDTLVAQYNDLESVEALFAAHGQDIACIIVEPVVGNCGFVKPESGFLEGLRSVADKYDSLLIFDEVMTGFRVDLRGAQGLFGVTPDLTMLGKVIGGGLPVGAFGGRRDIMQLLAPLGNVYQAGTLSGNPLAMAAGAETLRTWGSGDTFSETCEVTKQLIDVLKGAASRNSIPIQAASIGTMFGFFFADQPVRSFGDTSSVDKDLFSRFFSIMLDRGVYFAPSAFEAGFVSYAHAQGPIEYAIAQLEEGFDELAQG